MAGVARPLALPRGWPRGLRSAAVHAVSIAEFALTTALGWAARSLNPRLRLRAELERLRNEVLLLREEIRIKDALHGAHRGSEAAPLSTDRAAGDHRASCRTRMVSCPNRPRLSRAPLTIASWTGRLDEERPDALLLRLPEPVNT